MIEIWGRTCNLVHPERRLEKLIHSKGTTTIQVAMVPGIIVICLFALATFGLIFYGAMQTPMLISRSLHSSTDWNGFMIFLFAAPIFLAFAGGGFALGAYVWRLVFGNETLTITAKTARYVDGASSKRSRTAATNSLTNLQIKNGIAGKNFESRYALTGSLAGEAFDFGAGLPEDELLKILDFILEHHPGTK